MTLLARWLRPARPACLALAGALFALRLDAWADRVLGWVLRPIQGGADTTVATGAAAAAQRWGTDLWMELPEHVFWAPYMKPDVNAIIQVKQDLEAQPGEKITFTLARQLSAAAVTGDSTLEGNEEAITFYSDSVTLDQKRNAVRLTGKLSEKRTVFSQRTTAKQLLKDWLAALIDSNIFTQLTTSPSAGRAVYGGSATSTATIAAGDFLTLALCTRAKVLARKATPQIFPVRVDGGDYFVLVISPDCLHDLKNTDPAWAQAQREAQMRGEKNPLFTGAEGIYDSVVLRSSTRVPLTTTWGAGSNIAGSENILAGRQAGVIAWGAKPEWVEASFDYANKTGFAIGAIFVAKKAVFNAVDNGVILVRTARNNIT